MLRRVYLDHNAGAPLREVARRRLHELLERGLANPSSVHAEGRAARDVLEQAREELAALAGCARDELVFTSGGTEANALALGLAAPGAGVALAATEHPSLRAAADARDDAVLLPVDAQGRVRVPEPWPRVALTSVALANHETGCVQDLDRLVPLARAAGSRVHSDLSQAFGRLPVHVGALDLDAATLSAHKLGGPPGVGALVLRDGLVPRPLWQGGAQEGGLRPGTESVALASAFAAAAREACAELQEMAARLAEHVAHLRSRIREIVPDARVLTPAEGALPNTLNVAFPGRRGAALVMRLDLEGVAASHGSACASGSREPSRVLLAMGCDEDTARASVRFSLGHTTTRDDVRACVAALARALAAVPARGARKNARATPDA